MDLKIGELAQMSGCQAETIRFYEQKGLLPPPLRSAANYRLYGAAHAERLQFIRRCRALGMSLGEVAALLGYRDAPQQPCDGVNALVDSHVAAIEGQIAELRTLQAELARLRSSCASARSAGECRILKELATPPAGN